LLNCHLSRSQYQRLCDSGRHGCRNDIFGLDKWHILDCSAAGFRKDLRKVCVVTLPLRIIYREMVVDRAFLGLTVSVTL
jgi:hypothetical protein